MREVLYVLIGGGRIHAVYLYGRVYGNPPVYDPVYNPYTYNRINTRIPYIRYGYVYGVQIPGYAEPCSKRRIILEFLFFLILRQQKYA